MDSSEKRGDRTSRRRFLEQLFAGTLIGAATPAVLSGALLPRLSITSRAGESLLSGFYTIDLSTTPALQSVGGSVRLAVNQISPTFRIIITRISDDQFEAVNARCTHNGSLVYPRQEGEDFLLCRAHGSKFQLDGTYISGPANGVSLERYSTTYDGANLVSVEIDQLASIDESDRQENYVRIHSTGPMRGAILLDYSIADAGHVLLTLWSLQGEEIVRLLDEERPAGKGRISCDLSSHPSGLYLFRMELEGQLVGTGKLVL